MPEASVLDPVSLGSSWGLSFSFASASCALTESNDVLRSWMSDFCWLMMGVAYRYMPPSPTASPTTSPMAAAMAMTAAVGSFFFGAGVGADGAAAGWLSCVAGGCCACMGVGSVTVLFFLLGGHTVVQPVLVIFYDLYGHIEFACDEVRVRTVHALGYRVLMRVDETQGGI